MSTNPEDFFDQAAKSIEEENEQHEAEKAYDEWDPKTPSTLRGYFMKATRHMTRYGPAYKAYVKDFDTEVGVTVFCARKMLREGLLEASPKPGALVVFEYQGQKESESGFEYGAYYVRASESDPAYWAEVTRPKPGEEDKAQPTTNNGSSSGFQAPSDAPF